MFLLQLMSIEDREVLPGFMSQALVFQKLFRKTEGLDSTPSGRGLTHGPWVLHGKN